ncbi:hypothetical protein LMG9673_04782 [Ralstonia pseudosolanacearum]|nr:hypothetical protein LMG9673_04782 [Ralstonia pseudosolanacearum]
MRPQAKNKVHCALFSNGLCSTDFLLRFGNLLSEVVSEPPL